MAGDEPLWVEPKGLSDVSPRFAGIAQQVEDVITKLRNGIDDERKCWGSDDPGKRFDTSYQPGADAELADLKKLADTINSVAVNLAATAGAFAARDQANADRYRQA